ncbi:MAG: TatD family hydrolase [Bacteroidota bacterium]
MAERADKVGIINILLPAIDAATHEKMLEKEGRFYPNCLSMMGLHPCSVKGNYVAELDIVEGYLAKRKFVAIGETVSTFTGILHLKISNTKLFSAR